MAMFKIESDKDKKQVNVLSFGKELPLLRYPILNNTYKVLLTTKEIKHCLDNGVIVEEVFDDGVVRLNMDNYDKDNSKAERYVELNLAKSQKDIAEEEAKKKAEAEAAAKKAAEEAAKKKAEEEAKKKAEAEAAAKKAAEEAAKKKAEEEAKKKAEAEAAAKKAAEEAAKKKAAEEAAKKQQQQNAKKN